MPSHLSGAPRELAVEIMCCPILAACLEESGYRLACYDVAVDPGVCIKGGRGTPSPPVVAH